MNVHPNNRYEGIKLTLTYLDINIDSMEHVYKEITPTRFLYGSFELTSDNNSTYL